jgi:tripartite ATP-independent transporter DctM subunit
MSPVHPPFAAGPRALRRWRARARAAGRRVERALTILLAGLLAGLIGIVAAAVVARHLASTSLTFAEELAQWLFLAIIFLAIPVAHGRGGHVAFTALRARLSGAGATAAEVAGRAVLVWTTLQLGLNGARLAALIGGVSPSLQLPYALLYGVVPVSAAVSLVVLGLRGIARGEAWVTTSAFAVALAIEAALAGFGAPWAGASPSLVLLVSFFAAFFLAVPIAFAMLFAAFTAHLGADLLPGPAVIQNLVKGSGQYLLLAIPFFLTTANLMNAGGLTSRILDLAAALIGHVRGGFAQINVVSSLLYGGISGSSAADAALDTKVMVPQMVRAGYAPAFSCAITAAAAILPNIVAPSVAKLIYAGIANVSVGKLFIAGILPGLAIAAALMVTVWAVARRRGYGAARARAPFAEVRAKALAAAPPLFVAVLVIGGIRSGIVTPTEAGVIGIFWALLLGVGCYRAYDAATLWRQFHETAVEAALISLLIGAAAPFTWVLVTERIPQQVLDLLLGLTGDKIVLLLIVNFAMLVAGALTELIAAMLILVPMFLPLLAQLHVDAVHFGMIILVNMMFGALLPPHGYLAFITAQISGTPIHEVFAALVPFIVVLIVMLLIVTFVPALSLALV